MCLRTNPEVRDHFRILLATARAHALADAEAGPHVVFAIESLGRYFRGSNDALGVVRVDLVAWVTRELPGRADDLDRRLGLLVRGRNDRMHKGFTARNLTKDAVRVVLLLEEAMMVGWKTTRFGT